MSSFQSPGNAPAQRIPAWKRLGLKLKATSEEQSQNATLHPSTAAPLVPNHRRENPAGPIDTTKRKSSGVPALDRSAKKAKRDVPQSQTTPIRTSKKVSFAVDSNQGAGSPAATNGTQSSTKQKPPSTKKTVPASAKPVKKQGPVNLEPALAYLRQWYNSKDTWKFNKNHQTRLLEQVFADETTIPAADIHIFYEYIRGLKGGVRTRLKELASGTKAQDMEQGSEGFSASGKEMAERKQKEYQEVIAAFLGQPRTPGKRRFEEVDYVLRTSDMDMQRRVVKRMRCEMVLDELSDSETETESTTTTTTTTTSTENGSSTAGEFENGTNGVATDGAEDVLRLRLNDGPQQRLKRKRKVRTAIVDEETSSESDSSSSDSESDSDADSSSDSSSSDESDDEVVQPQLRANEDETSSSSSSSESDASDDEESDED
ncbi:hypothetical protein F4818DRAFT_288999 [Hypoxylon cercidicola]|nr:hypothetical protein F4818DRAFT_288999 [Hypoxylon cercidicola]